MLRLAFASVLFLSVVARAQTANQTGIAIPDDNPPLNPISICLNQSDAGTAAGENAFTVPKFGFDFCLHQEQIPAVFKQTVISQANSSSDIPAAPDAPRPDSSSKSDTHNLSGASPVSPRLPDTNSGRRIIDRRFILLQTFSALALVADLESTAHIFAGRQPQATELDPLFGKRPTRARLYGIGVPLDAFVVYMSYYAKKVAPKRKLWEIGPGLSIAVHSGAAINNLVVATR